MLADAPVVTAGAWIGTLPDLVSAIEGGHLSAIELNLESLIAQVRGATVDLDEAATAFALLARTVELKARALLPAPPPEPEPVVEPDAEAEAAQLAERVAAYRAFAEAAAALRTFEAQRRDRYGRPEGPAPQRAAPVRDDTPGETLERLLQAFSQVWERSAPRTREVQRERFTLAQTVALVRSRLVEGGPLEFGALFALGADRLEIVVTFLAVLELVRLGHATVEQGTPFGPVRIAARPAASRGSGDEARR